MKYEKTKIKKTDPKKVVLHDMEMLSTLSILLFLIRRHRIAILLIWAISVTLYSLFPQLPSFLGAIIFS